MNCVHAQSKTWMYKFDQDTQILGTTLSNLFVIDLKKEKIALTVDIPQTDVPNIKCEFATTYYWVYRGCNSCWNICTYSWRLLMLKLLISTFSY